MKYLQTALNKIHEKTGIDMALYSAFGEPVFSVGKRQLPFVLPAPEDFIGNVASDEKTNVTYLRVRRQPGNCYILIDGSGRESKNYALLIENALTIEEERYTQEASIEDRMRLLLAGELSSVQRNMMRAALSDVKFNHYLLSLVTKTREMQKQLLGFLSQLRDKRDYIVTMDARTIVLFRHVNEEDGYRSATDFAQILYENVKEELRIDLVVSTGGTIRSFHELIQCYEKVIFTYKFGKLLMPNTNVYSYKDYVLIRLLADIPKPQLMRYLDSLLEPNATEVISDAELMETAEEFMNNSLNISETSRNMYIHRNTLIYRLDKIEKDSGLNLREFNDAVTFRLIKILNTLIKGE